MKKKIFVMTACALTFVMCLLGFAGCWLFKAADKDYEVLDMKITLTDDFYELENIAQTGCFQSQKAIVTALKESFSEYPGLDGYTLMQYTSASLEANGIDADIYQREGKNYMYFTYERSAGGKDFYYLATTHKTGDAFWLIQFGCETKNKEEFIDKFLNWADTVTFSSYGAL